MAKSFVQKGKLKAHYERCKEQEKVNTSIELDKSIEDISKMQDFNDKFENYFEEVVANGENLQDFNDIFESYVEEAIANEKKVC